MITNQIKNTPGPWIASPTGSHIYKEDYAGLEQCVLFDCFDTGVFNERQKNCSMAAAAPELLDVLKKSIALLKILAKDHPLVKAGKQAIARAEGKQR